MINSLIKGSSRTDYYCNLIISTSNDIANDLGVSYSELWLWITFLTIGLIVYYIVVSYGSIYSKHKSIFKIMFWMGNIFIGILIFIFISIISTLYVNP